MNRFSGEDLGEEEPWIRLFCCRQRGAIFQIEGSDGANLNTFCALRADRIGHRFVQERGDHSLKASSRKANGSDLQLLLAYPNAFAAENTFIGVIAQNRTAFIDREAPLEFPETVGLHFYTEALCNLEEFTGAAFLAMGTGKGMIGEQKLRSSTGKPESRFASCVNHHAFFDKLGTGRNRFLSPLYFNKAEATGRGSLFSRMAQRLGM